jgi:NADPH:quinone reductase-like Zn-dependent oxidoreductase
MRAMQMKGYGGPEQLQLVELAQPLPQSGKVLVRVHCASVNPVDWKRASGALRLIMPMRFPAVPGYDVAGDVVSMGAGVGGFSVGMRVHARIADMNAGGCADYAIVGAAELVPMPDGMPYDVAAALPLAGMTALQGLRDGAGLPMVAAAGTRVLVVGASGGVGHIGVQIAKSAGAWVTGVCSGANAPRVRELGADEVLDYTRGDAFKGIAPFDVVLDCVGGDPGPWLRLMTAQARYVSVIPGPLTFIWPLLNPFSRRRVRAWMLKTNGDDLRALDALWQRGSLKVVIDGRYPLPSLGQAWQRSISGRAVGKIVIEVA